MSGELEPLSRHEMRASHEDRDMIVERLRVAAGDGRIDHDELDQRIEAAMSARTYGELEVIVRDLPEAPGTAVGPPARRADAQPEQTVDVAHGKVVKNGPWQVPQRLNVSARHSTVVLDFNDAVFSGPREVEVMLDVRHSNVRLVLPEGSVVDDALTVRRHSNVTVRGYEVAGPGGVVLRLTGASHHANIRAWKLPERTRRLLFRRGQQRRQLGR
jgi:hypothetical protein